MARIKDEISAALPTLSKLVFSQPVDKSDDAKVSVRPVLLKGGLFFRRSACATIRQATETSAMRSCSDLYRSLTEGTDRYSL